MPVPQAQLKWALEKVSGQEHANFVRRFNLTDYIPTKQTIKTKASGSQETSFTLSEKFNQDTTFVYKGIEYRTRDCGSFSFARDWIADFSSGSEFEQALTTHLKPALGLSELAAININTRWPTLATVFD
ncbi:hypothetical protein BGX27_003387 [Mortierella sp. AM989]|nr:hypothetical protein BGX27_003387 [Mortierella sp. AM989]